MLKLRNAALSMAVLLALTACGGSSSSDTTAADTPVIVPGDNTGTPPGDNSGGPVTPEPDAVFTGSMITVGNQILFNGTAYANAQDLSTFNTTGVYAQEAGAAGASTPLASIGIRVGQAAMNDQSDNIRVAVEFDNADTDQNFKFLIQGATLSVDAAGIMSLTVPATATGLVTLDDGTGNTASVPLTAVPASALSISTTPVDGSDPNSFALSVNLAAIMDAAIAAADPADALLLDTVSNANATGRYNVRMALTGVTLENEAGNPVTVDQPITVGTQPAVGGSGVTGLLYHNTPYPI